MKLLRQIKYKNTRNKYSKHAPTYLEIFYPNIQAGKIVVCKFEAISIYKLLNK